MPLFEAMGKTSVYLGETGSAAKMKLVVNMIMVGSCSEGRGGGGRWQHRRATCIPESAAEWRGMVREIRDALPQGSMMAALAEGLGLSKEAGLRQEDLLAILNQSALASPMIALKAGG